MVTLLLTVFVLAQFFLSEALSGRDKALDQLRSEMSDLVEVLALERKTTEELRGQVANLSGELQTSIGLRDQLSEALRAMELRATSAEGDAAKAASDIEALNALKAGKIIVAAAGNDRDDMDLDSDDFGGGDDSNFA